MFVYKSVVAELETAAGQAKLLASSKTAPTSDDVKLLLQKCQKLNAICDQVLAKYESSGNWEEDGFLSAQQTIAYKTGSHTANVKRSLEKGRFLLQNELVRVALDDGLISYDHIVPLIPLTEDRYEQFFVDDTSEILEVAKLMPAVQFSRFVTHWKYMVNEICENDDESKRYEERYIHLYESEFGYWRIDGKLDPVTGKILKKAIEDVRNQLWRSHQEQRGECRSNQTDSVATADSSAQVDLVDTDEIEEDYSPEKQRADAIGYLAQGYVSASLSASTPQGNNPKHHSWFAYKVADTKTASEKTFKFNLAPSLSADIVIDINDLKPHASTRPFIEICLTKTEPILNAHSRNYREHILCDSVLDVPVNRRDGTYDLGRSVRSAPFKLKRQLMLGQKSCTVPGCTTPAQWCDAHHIQHWVHGGKTSLDNLTLLCRRHHSMMHNNKMFAEKIQDKLKPQLIRTG